MYMCIKQMYKMMTNHNS